MRKTRVAKRYAKSLLTLVIDQNELESTYQDMQLVADTCEASHDLSLLLRSPIVKGDKKTAIIHQIFGKKISELSLSFIDIITNKGREAHLEQIANEFISQYKLHKNITTAVVTSAIPLDKDLREKILAIVKAASKGEVDLVEKVDENIIGGFIIRIGDKQVDASIHSRLHALKMEFSMNPYIKEF